MRAIAEKALNIALAGLSRRNRSQNGYDERRYLEPIARLLDRGRCPADELIDGIEGSTGNLRDAIIAHARA